MKKQKIILIIIIIFIGNCQPFLLKSLNIPYVNQVDIESKNVKLSDSTCPYDFFFNKTWGGAYQDYALSIDSDSSGNIYIAGKYDRGGSGVVEHYFLSKLNKKGDLMWNKTFSINDFRIAQIKVKQDKIYVIDNYDSPDSNLTLHIYDIFGTLMFNKTFHLNEPVSIYDLTIDSLNNIYVVGGWHMGLYPDGFICKISSTYSIEWYRTWWKSPDPLLKGCFLAVTLDNNEDIIVTGYANTLDPRIKDILLVKYNKNGDMVWDKWWGSSGDEWGSEVKVDSTDSIYHISTGNIKNVTKFTDDGIIIWTKTFNNPDIQDNWLKFDDIIIDSSEDLIVSGRVKMSSGEDKIILLKYDKYGFLEWNFTSDFNYNIYLSYYARVVLMSDKYENICFATSTYVSTNNMDILLNKIIINHSPHIKQNSNNFTAAYGSSGHILSWYAIDFDGNYDIYWIERDGENLFEQIWTYDMDIEFIEMNDSLPLGVYNYTCFVKDLYGCVNHSSVFVTIAHIPYYSDVKIPNNNIYSPNAEYAFNCSWFDYDGVIQEVKFEFNSQNFTVKNNYSGEYSYTLKDLPANESGHNFRWHAKDNDGYWRSTDILIFIIHKQNSELLLLFNNTPGDHIALMNDLVNITVYNVDLLSGVFQLYINQELIEEKIGDSLSNFSQFSIGIYNITAVFYNTNYTGEATNWLSVINYPYFVNQTSNVDILEGDIYKTITWTPIDDLGSYDLFWIQKDGINIINGTWDGSEIVFSDLFNLQTGVYNFTCFVNNTFGLRNSSTIIVNVLPNNNPFVDKITDDFTVNVGTIGYSFSWYVIDIDGNNHTYWIERSGVRIDNGFWDNNTIITFIETDNTLLPRLYNYSCFVNDTCGAKHYSSVFVTVINHEPQIVNNINDFTVNVGTIGYSLSWHVQDIDGNTLAYWIERSGVRIDNGFWTNDTDIIFIETDNTLLPGLYNYTCFVNDTYGAKHYSSIFVTIINHEPQIVNNINDFTVNVGSIGYSLSWHVLDIDGNTLAYWIERNGVKVDSGFWTNDMDIIFIETDNTLLTGLYNYTCFVNDTCGTMNYSSIVVKINAYPYYSDISLPLNNIYSPFADYIFNCTWFDYDGAIQEVKLEFNYQNYTVISNFSGKFTYTLFNLAANEEGYSFRWHAMDNDGAWNSTDWQVFILKKKVVQLMILFNGTEGNYIDDFNPIINLTIINLNFTPGTLRLFVNSELRQEISAYRLEYISQFLNSKYNITVLLTDVNYTGYAMKWLNIIEETPPEIIFKFSESYLNSTTPEYFHRSLEISCTIYDSSPITWVYLCENTSGIYVNNSMISLGNSNWKIILDISNLGWNDIFSFYFYANDTWGNIGKEDNSSMLYLVKIYDFQPPSSKISYIHHSGTNIVNKSSLFSIIANDNQGSGIFETFYSINNSNWINYTKPFDLSDFIPGTYIISFYSIDYAGNIEEIHSITIILIEEQPPDSPPDEDDDINQRSRSIPGYSVILFIFGTIFISICYLFKHLKKKRII